MKQEASKIKQIKSFEAFYIKDIGIKLHKQCFGASVRYQINFLLRIKNSKGCIESLPLA
jgi:hypothetical protein